MKKNYYLFFYLIIIGYICTYDQYIFQQISQYNHLFFYSYLPSIIPFTILTNILLKNIELNKLYLYFYYKKLGIIFDLIIIMMMALLGLPSNLIIAKNLQQNNIYSSKKTANLIYYFSIISLPFIYTYSNHDVIFVCIYFLVNLSFFFLFSSQEANLELKDESIKINIIKDSMESILSTYLTLLLSLFPFIIFKYYFQNIYLYLFSSLIELSYFMISLFSISEMYLIKKVFPNLKIVTYMKKRLITAFFITLIYFFLTAK
jgi:hypothetical protein